jgi:hypothetical protein
MGFTKMNFFSKISWKRYLKGAFFLVLLSFACIGAWNLATKGVKSAASLTNTDSDVKENESKKTPEPSKEIKPQYSFYKDTDRDGLTNGWEHVFGTDLQKPDTDGDGYTDKEEVDEGFDPLIGGEAKLDERKTENLSIDYYQWTRKQDIKTPTLEFNSRIRDFAQTKGLLKLEKVPNTFLETDPSESVKGYLEKLQNVSLPRAAFDYQTLASGYKGDEPAVQKKLQDLLSRVELALAGAKKIHPPPEAKEVHKKHLKVLVNFRGFLKDLKKARRDPVRIKINLFKSGKLIKEAVEAENLKQKISS